MHDAALLFGLTFGSSLLLLAKCAWTIFSIQLLTESANGSADGLLREARLLSQLALHQAKRPLAVFPVGVCLLGLLASSVGIGEVCLESHPLADFIIVIVALGHACHVIHVRVNLAKNDLLVVPCRLLSEGAFSPTMGQSSLLAAVSEGTLIVSSAASAMDANCQLGLWRWCRSGLFGASAVKRINRHQRGPNHQLSFHRLPCCLLRLVTRCILCCRQLVEIQLELHGREPGWMLG